jgi:hypothetical protein
MFNTYFFSIIPFLYNTVSMPVNKPTPKYIDNDMPNNTLYKILRHFVLIYCAFLLLL